MDDIGNVGRKRRRRRCRQFKKKNCCQVFLRFLLHFFSFIFSLVALPFIRLRKCDSIAWLTRPITNSDSQSSPAPVSSPKSNDRKISSCEIDKLCSKSLRFFSRCVRVCGDEFSLFFFFSFSFSFVRVIRKCYKRSTNERNEQNFFHPIIRDLCSAMMQRGKEAETETHCCLLIEKDPSDSRRIPLLLSLLLWQWSLFINHFLFAFCARCYNRQRWFHCTEAIAVKYVCLFFSSTTQFVKYLFDVSETHLFQKFRWFKMGKMSKTSKV